MTDNELTVEGIEGTEATIACRATGLPKPTYEFYKVSRSNMAATSKRFLEVRVNGVNFSKVKTVQTKEI